MISQKRILAARANGALSRGPKTPEGKARSRNAVRSRRLTDCTVLGNESREAFQDLFNFHVDCFSPLDDVEMGMVEEMASAYWRIRRNWAIENYLLESAAAAQPEGPELPRIAAASPNSPPDRTSPTCAATKPASTSCTSAPSTTC